VCHFGA